MPTPTLNHILMISNQRRAEVERLRAAIRGEHFRTNGASVYMNPPQHERSIMRCKHPLCSALDSPKPQLG